MWHFEYREDRQRGTADLPIQLYHVDRFHPQYRMVYHWHYDFEIISVLKGSFRLRLDEEESILHEGDIAIVTGSMLHGGNPDACVYECIVFSPELIRHRDFRDDDFIRQIAHGDIRPCRIIKAEESSSHPMTRTCLEAVTSELKTGNPDALAISGYLKLFFSELCRSGLYENDSLREKHGRKRCDQLRHVLEYLETNYAERLKLSDIASEAGLSPRYFCSLFQEMTGQTPFGYLNMLRVEKACSLMIREHLSVTDAALMTGFSDPAYFSRVFRRHMGVSPREYALSDHS
ncbi:MAG: helix-turn-helix domain-containing protein [Bullifex sp.]